MTQTHLLRLYCRPGEWIVKPNEGKRYKTDLDLHVVNDAGEIQQSFELMCESIYDDIQTVSGSGAVSLEAIRRIESEKVAEIETSGNAWVTYITREKVWFEGLYGQGEGGEVTFEQYKLAVQTYLRFLADPEQKNIEIEFPGVAANE